MDRSADSWLTKSETSQIGMLLDMQHANDMCLGFWLPN